MTAMDKISSKYNCPTYGRPKSSIRNLSYVECCITTWFQKTNQGRTGVQLYNNRTKSRGRSTTPRNTCPCFPRVNRHCLKPRCRGRVSNIISLRISWSPTRSHCGGRRGVKKKTKKGI